MPFTVDNRVLPFLFVEVRLVAYFVLCFVAPSSSMRLNKIRFGVTTVSMPLPLSLLSIVVRFCCVQPYINGYVLYADVVWVSKHTSMYGWPSSTICLFGCFCVCVEVPYVFPAFHLRWYLFIQLKSF